MSSILLVGPYCHKYLKYKPLEREMLNIDFKPCLHKLPPFPHFRKLELYNDTDTFSWYQIFSIPIPVLFSVPNFFDTGSDAKFYRYRFRECFPVPNFSDTGSHTTTKNENSRYLYRDEAAEVLSGGNAG